MKFIVSLAFHGRSYYLLRDPTSKRKMIKIEKSFLFEEEKHNKNSILQKEVDKINGQLQEYKIKQQKKSDNGYFKRIRRWRCIRHKLRNIDKILVWNQLMI